VPREARGPPRALDVLEDLRSVLQDPVDRGRLVRTRRAFLGLARRREAQDASFRDVDRDPQRLAGPDLEAVAGEVHAAHATRDAAAVDEGERHLLGGRLLLREAQQEAVPLESEALLREPGLAPVPPHDPAR